MAQRTVRTAVFDGELRVEAYRLRGHGRPFPAHFHDHYVLGLMEAGERRLRCGGTERTLRAGDLMLLNPGESHACAPEGNAALDYRGLNVPAASLAALAQRATGQDRPLRFARPTVRDPQLAAAFRQAHDLLLEGAPSLETEERLLLVVAALARDHSADAVTAAPADTDEAAAVQRACAYLERHFAERIGLDDVCREACASTSTLLRAFSRQKGITPYRYLESVRVKAARRLLARGASVADAALQAGFSDQSHFTNQFARLTGLTPGLYRGLFQTPDGNGAHRA